MTCGRADLDIRWRLHQGQAVQMERGLAAEDRLFELEGSGGRGQAEPL
ncbi:hypothetical protein ACFP47_07010 [Nesterenkonia lacusekhoensis]|nr:hypothetical protein [Nesterenkonia lacusekhoensis]